MARTAVIVDDSDVFRESARLLLESQGFTVLAVADTVVAGFRAVVDNQPDLALLDVQLPDGTGFDLSRRLLAAGSSSGLVLTSSRPASDYGEQIQSSGALGFIAKDRLSAEALEPLLEGGRRRNE